MEITRRQGRVVLVGYVRLDIHPKHFLYREIDLRYSRAYGPGSYHAGYEKGRLDYPFGYVRWTEKRNLAEFVRLLATGAVDARAADRRRLRPRRRPGRVRRHPRPHPPGIAALIRYGDEEPDRSRTRSTATRGPKRPGRSGSPSSGSATTRSPSTSPTCGRSTDVEIRGIASATARNAAVVAEKVGRHLRHDRHRGASSPTRAPTASSSRRASPSTTSTSAGRSKPARRCSSRSRWSPRSRTWPVAAASGWTSRTPSVFAVGLNRRYSPCSTQLEAPRSPRRSTPSPTP